MASKRRGDADATTPEPVAEVSAEREGFPVQAVPAPEADADVSAEPGATDVAATEGRDSVADSATTTPQALTFHREFRKHAVTGEVVAIELVGGMFQAARLCSKPEEQTHGALPVMALEDRDSDIGQWYRKNALEFKPWEPPQPPKQLLDRLRSLYEQAVVARDAYESAKRHAKNTKERVEEVDEAIFHALRRMHDVPDGQAELPLDDDDGDGTTDVSGNHIGAPRTDIDVALAAEEDNQQDEAELLAQDDE